MLAHKVNIVIIYIYICRLKFSRKMYKMYKRDQNSLILFKLFISPSLNQCPTRILGLLEYKNIYRVLLWFYHIIHKEGLNSLSRSNLSWWDYNFEKNAKFCLFDKKDNERDKLFGWGFSLSDAVSHPKSSYHLF